LYDKTIRVDFIRSIRKEIKFANSEALKRQIFIDAKAARDILKEVL
jgi:FAD synthase